MVVWESTTCGSQRDMQPPNPKQQKKKKNIGLVKQKTKNKDGAK
jgi:hypothetical protein